MLIVIFIFLVGVLLGWGCCGRAWVFGAGLILEVILGPFLLILLLGCLKSFMDYRFFWFGEVWSGWV
ncbi:hypothetical protein DRO56_02360 [Candidatus Bathyarchaeota archaeon]|nr:MAG: hypothetical protein DRO56_02360 [Candidatus Bathyarchaeota archaeon]